MSDKKIYQITNPLIAAGVVTYSEKNKAKARKEFFEQKGIEMVKVAQGSKTFTLLSQFKYPKTYLGNSTYYTIANSGCFLTSVTIVHNYLTGENLTPPEMNEKLKSAGCFNGASLIFEKVCETLGWDYVGKFTGIDATPESKGVITPTIKEVDYSYRAGKQQHFVVRVHTDNGNYIIDPLGGIVRAIDYYEKLVDDEKWASKYFSYRIFKP